MKSRPFTVYCIKFTTSSHDANPYMNTFRVAADSPEIALARLGEQHAKAIVIEMTREKEQVWF